MLAEAAWQRAVFFRAQWDKRRAHLQNGGNGGLTSSPRLTDSCSAPKVNFGGFPYGLVEGTWSPTRDPDEISRPNTSPADLGFSSGPSKRRLPGLRAISLSSFKHRSQNSASGNSDQDSIPRCRSAGSIGFGDLDKSFKWNSLEFPSASLGFPSASSGVKPKRQNAGPRPVPAYRDFMQGNAANPTLLPDLLPWHQMLQDKPRARTPQQELLSPTRCTTWRARSMLSHSKPFPHAEDSRQHSQRSMYSFTLPDEMLDSDRNNRGSAGMSVTWPGATTRFDDGDFAIEYQLQPRSRPVSGLTDRSLKTEETAELIERRRSLRCSFARASIKNARTYIAKAPTKTLLNWTTEEYEDHAKQVFRALNLPRYELAHKEIQPFLLAIGHREIRQDWLDDIIQTSCIGRQNLDEEDAMVIAAEYNARFREQVEQESAGTEHGAGRSRAHHKLLRNLTETRLFPGADKEFLLTVSDGRRNSLRTASVEDILNMRDMIVDNFGFTPADHARIMNTFDRYDRDGDNRLNIRELSLALSWLGADPTFIRTVSKSHNPEDLLDQAQFLQEMKLFFEHEEERLSREFHAILSEVSIASGEEQYGELNFEELPLLFRRLGHISATPKVLEEIMMACGLTGKKRCLVEDAHRIFIKWHEHQGFLATEVAEIDEAFAEFDIDSSGSMDAPELEVAIRWLGYPSTYQLVRELVEEYDIDESGEVDPDEFTGFVARFRDNNMGEILRAFEYHDKDNSNTLDIRELRNALLQLGYVPTAEQTQQLIERGGGVGTCLNIWEFHDLVTTFRLEARSELRSNKCFTDREVKQLKSKFKQFDPKDTGEIANQCLAKLLTDMFPRAREHIESHRKARQILEQADENGDGKIQFNEFLKMMRLFRYHLRHEELHKECDALDHITLQKEEVKDLRRIFEMFDKDSSGDLTPGEVHQMLCSVLQMGDTSTTIELMEKIREVDTDGNRVLDFPEFLYFMQGLFDENWKNIKNISKAQADRAEREAEARERLSSANSTQQTSRCWSAESFRL